MIGTKKDIGFPLNTPKYAIYLETSVSQPWLNFFEIFSNHILEVLNMQGHRLPNRIAELTISNNTG